MFPKSNDAWKAKSPLGLVAGGLDADQAVQ
jgi:hypothetical protein